MKISRLFLLTVLAAVALPAMSQKVMDIDLWNGKTPNDNGLKDNTANVRVFLPSEKTATGRAVVICPGGGYVNLAMNHEGYDWAGFFNNLGIAAVVLKYRMPNGNPDVPISDAEKALDLVRRNAAAWKINPSDIGIMGFSAGGHLASTVATQAQEGKRPAFQILFYPVITMMQGYTHQGSHDNLIGKDAKKKLEQKYSSDLQVTRVTPRACIILSDDDHVVPPSNGVNYYFELYRHDVPASLFVYPSGGHGYGIGLGFKYHAEMLLDLEAWLHSF